MSDEIKERLQATGAQCLSAYEAWAKDQKDEKAREDLQESIHELRKVTSRLEIELAISERDQMGQKKLPIPPHRAARKKGQQEIEEAQGGNGNGPDNDDSSGNSDNGGPKKEVKVQRRGRSGGGRKSAGGGNS